MVVNFEVGKTYVYNGKIGDPSPFVGIHIEEQDALLIVSGKPLVCTYVENHPCPFVTFEGSAGGWVLNGRYHLFDEVKEKTVAKETQKEEKKEMPKFKIGGKYRYTGPSDSVLDFIRIGIDGEDAEYIVSGEPLTVEFLTIGNRIKFEEFENSWSFLSDMLEKFEEVTIPVSKDKYVPAKKFETGKWYVCHLNERPRGWNCGGKMDGLLDGKPHKCIMGNKIHAEFEHIPLRGEAGWDFRNTIDYFEEVPAPSSEVDWEKKYAELEKRYNKLKGVFVEYLIDEEVC